MWMAAVVALMASSDDLCARQQAIAVGGTQVWRAPGAENALVYEGGLAIDADGAPDAYHPEDRGLDALANAGKPGHWWGVVTAGGEESGEPVVQGPSDPKPGYYVSSTSLQDKSKKRTDPRRYVDSSSVPYLAVSPLVLAGKLAGGARVGDLAAVVSTATGRVAYAVVADVGPKDKLGEGSIALAQALGVKDASPRRGGARSGIVYVVFPGSSAGWPRTNEDIAAAGAKLFEAWGGVPRIEACRR
jgi:hypothetical protein